MTIQTRDFGTLELNADELIHMVSPVLGFDKLSTFALLSEQEMDTPFIWLQSTEKTDVCFVLLDPSAVFADYAPEATAEMVSALGAASAEDLVWRVMTVITPDFADSTANLKSPLVICPATKKAGQFILDADYPLRAYLIPRGQEGSAC